MADPELDTISVKSAKVTDPTDVVVWDVDPMHPDGEVFIKTDGETHEVGRTPIINRKLNDHELVVVDEADIKLLLAPKPAPEGEGEGLPPTYDLGAERAGNASASKVVSTEPDTLAAAREAEAKQAAANAPRSTQTAPPPPPPRRPAQT